MWTPLITWSSVTKGECPFNLVGKPSFKTIHPIPFQQSLWETAESVCFCFAFGERVESRVSVEFRMHTKSDHTDIEYKPPSQKKTRLKPTGFQPEAGNCSTINHPCLIRGAWDFFFFFLPYDLKTHLYWKREFGQSWTTHRIVCQYDLRLGSRALGSTFFQFIFRPFWQAVCRNSSMAEFGQSCTEKPNNRKKTWHGVRSSFQSLQVRDSLTSRAKGMKNSLHRVIRNLGLAVRPSKAVNKWWTQQWSIKLHTCDVQPPYQNLLNAAQCSLENQSPRSACWLCDGRTKSPIWNNPVPAHSCTFHQICPLIYWQEKIQWWATQIWSYNHCVQDITWNSFANTVFMVVYIDEDIGTLPGAQAKTFRLLQNILWWMSQGKPFHRVSCVLLRMVAPGETKWAH